MAGGFYRIRALNRVVVLSRRLLSCLPIVVAAILLPACHAVVPDPSSPSSSVPAANRGGGFVVKVAWNDAPFPGARVEWRLRPEGQAVLFDDVASDGRKTFRPAPGTYFVVAGWRPDGNFDRPLAPGDRFAYSGLNPVVVSSGAEGNVTLLLEEVPVVPQVVSGGTGVTGRVTARGVPVPGALVSVHNGFATGFRDRDFLGLAQTDAAGDFRIDLPLGSYYLVARRRIDGEVVGPMQKGNLFGYAPMNPVVVEAGRYSSMAVPMIRLNSTDSVVVRTKSSISGVIVDASGTPVEGVHAALYENPDLLGRPTYRSDPTGLDGVFEIPIAEPGRFFLGARTGYGGAPKPGGWYGRYEETPDHAVNIHPDERLQNLKIVVEKVP